MRQNEFYSRLTAPAFFSALLLLLAALCLPTPARATTLTWGGGAATWDVGVTANWSGSTWVNGSDALFNGASPNSITLSDEAHVVGSMTINSGAYTFNGNAGASDSLTLNNGITMNAGAGAVSFNPWNYTFNLGGNQTWRNDSSSDLNPERVNGLGYDLTLTGSGSGNINSTGFFFWNGAGNLTINLTGTGVFNYQHGVSHSGDTYFLSGTANNVGAQGEKLGTGTVYLGDTSGSADVTWIVTRQAWQAYVNPIVVQAGSTGEIRLHHGGDANPKYWWPAVTLNRDLIVSAGAGIAIKGTSAITGSGGIIVDGGIIQYSIANSYLGGTTINSGGELRLGASNVIPDTGVVTVKSGGVLNLQGFSEIVGGLRGNGTVSGTGVLTIAGGGTLSPGLSAGTLTVPNLTLGSAAEYDYEAGDLVNVTGALTLGTWTLNIYQGGKGIGEDPSASITLFTYDGGSTITAPSITNFFGFASTPSISFTDTGSALLLNGVYVIPEPGMLFLLALGGGLLAAWRRRPPQ